MSRPGVLFAAVFAAGVIALLAFAAFDQRDQAFTLGVAPVAPLKARAAQVICQTPIDVPAEFDHAVVTLADGTTMDARVGDARTHQPMEPPVPEGRRIEVCVEGPVTLLGNVPEASRSSEARRNAKPIQGDVAVTFVRDGSRSVLSLVPDVLKRASLFHGAWVKPWLMGLLGVLLLTAFPLLLAAALRESSQAPAPEAASRASNSSGAGKPSRTTDGEWASSSSRE